MDILLLVLSLVAIIGLVSAIKIVQQQEAWFIEKSDKFDRVLDPVLKCHYSHNTKSL